GGGYYGGPTYTAYGMRPTIKAFNSDGSPNIDLPTSLFNPIWVGRHDINKTLAYNLLNNTRLKLDLLDNLDFTSVLGLNFIVDQRKAYDNPIHGDGHNDNGRIYPGYSRTFNYTWKNTLSYNWDVNE